MVRLHLTGGVGVKLQTPPPKVGGSVGGGPRDGGEVVPEVGVETGVRNALEQRRKTLFVCVGQKF